MNKQRTCYRCKNVVTLHEEKRTDVNYALQVVWHAIRGTYDRALLFTGDSDQVPTVEMVKRLSPEKQFLVIAPPGRDPGWDLTRAAGGNKQARRLTVAHMEECLLPAEVLGADGSVVDHGCDAPGDGRMLGAQRQALQEPHQEPDQLSAGAAVSLAH